MSVNWLCTFNVFCKVVWYLLPWTSELTRSAMEPKAALCSNHACGHNVTSPWVTATICSLTATFSSVLFTKYSFWKKTMRISYFLNSYHDFWNNTFSGNLPSVFEHQSMKIRYLINFLTFRFSDTSRIPQSLHTAMIATVYFVKLHTSHEHFVNRFQKCTFDNFCNDGNDDKVLFTKTIFRKALSNSYVLAHFW